MKFPALEHEAPGVADTQFQPHLRAEAARAWELYQAGVLRELYFQAERPAVVLALECAGGSHRVRPDPAAALSRLCAAVRRLAAVASRVRWMGQFD